jgi:hypothetical protein
VLREVQKVLSDKGWQPLPEAIHELDSRTMPPPSEVAERVGWYVYGIVEAPGPVLPDGLLGVDGRHEPLAIVEGGLAAMVSEVPVEEFGDEALGEILEDPAWLENTASAHERVLEALWAQTTVVALPPLTVYRAESEICELLAGARRPLAS